MKKNYLYVRWLKSFLAIFATASQFLSEAQVIRVNEPNQNLPKYFATQSDTISINISSLTELFNKKPGDEVLVPTNTSYTIRGHLVSTLSKYDGQIKTAIINLTGLENVTLHFSWITPKESNPYYRALLTGKQSGDFMELKQINQDFFLIKGETNKLRLE